MRVELFPFQRRAVADLRDKAAAALNVYRLTHTPQVVSFTAPTGSGKTIIMSALIENILYGDEGKYVEQPDAIFVWLSDSPALNAQSRQKIDLKADKVRFDQCVTIDDESFNQEYLDDGHIYFLNTQKLGKKGNLTRYSDGRQYTIWDTLANTVREKSDRLYFIIDEAHRGMHGKDAGRAMSIMQKFIKGSPADKLPPIPVVIGMSATTQRFNALVEGTTSTIHKTIVTAPEVRSSGLLKDRIIITYPEDASGRNDMAVLQAAADEWKDKCLHWNQYCTDQHYAQVNPVFVIQVQSGTGKAISNTDLDDCLAKIEARTGWRFSEHEVVHTFGETGDLTLNGLTVHHVEPETIAEDRRIRIVFFKENLSTGWDCPRAETMMSFRRAEDATYIAQLLGRMVRTPLQSHILVDESLNDVHLYLPYFNEATVTEVINELQSAEGGEIPTVIEGEYLDDSNYVTLTTRPERHKKPEQQVEGQQTLFGQPDNTPAVTEPETPNTTGQEPVKPVCGDTEPVKQPHPQQEPTPVPVFVPAPEEPEAPAPAFDPGPSGHQESLFEEPIDRDAVVKAINDFGLLTYVVKSVRIREYLPSLLKLARLLSMTNIARSASNMVEVQIVKMIRDYIEGLMAKGLYESYSQKVLEYKLSTQIYDVFGESINNHAVLNLITSTDTDLDRQVRIADKQLGDFGASNRYGHHYFDPENPNSYKIDIILFAADDACMAALRKYAEDAFHEMDDTYRKYVIKQSEQYRTQYDAIITDGELVSRHSFRLPETIRVRFDKDGKEYSDHLFVDEKTGTARIKLNDWEADLIKQESKKPDFVCWLRNPSQEKWALCIPYEKNGETRSTYPDFLVIRRDPLMPDGYAIDILEPHSPDFADNLGKAKGFAKYAAENPGIGRIQLIHKGKNASGKSSFRRLDMSKGAIRNKVLAAQSNDELSHIFQTDGIFED